MCQGVENDDLRELRDGLPRLDMEPASARRARELALVAYARSLTRGRQPAVPGLYRSVLEPILVGGLALGFLAWVVGRSLEVLRGAPGGLL